MQHAHPIARISTDTVRPRERASFWREVVCRTFVELDCSPLGPLPLRGSLEDVCAGERHLCRVEATAQRVVRGREQIARSRGAYVVVCFQRSGSCVVAQDGRETRLEPGGLAAVDSTRPYVLHFAGPFSQQVLRIPQAALSCRIGRSERYTAIEVPGRDELARLLGGFLESLTPALAAAALPLRERLFGSAFDLTAAALACRVAGTRALSQHRLALLCRARQYCEEHLGDARLCPTDVARLLGISERYLQQLFSAEGGSVMQWVWERRLERCREQLADPALAARGVAEIAYAHGFSDCAHFSRRFRARYGESPSRYRRDYSLSSSGLTSSANSPSERIACSGARSPKENTHST
jgi:AraC-like DNA-binding protein